MLALFRLSLILADDSIVEIFLCAGIKKWARRMENLIDLFPRNTTGSEKMSLLIPLQLKPFCYPEDSVIQA